MEWQVCNMDWNSQSEYRGFSVQSNSHEKHITENQLKKKDFTTTTTHWHLKCSFIRLARAGGVITERPVWAAALEQQPPIDLNVGYSAGDAPLIGDPRATYNFLCAFTALCHVQPWQYTHPVKQKSFPVRDTHCISSPMLAKDKGKGVKVTDSIMWHY